MSEVPVVTHDPGCSRLSFSGNDWPETEHATHYLHLSAFPCEKCSGPVVAGWLGARRDHISKEDGIREIGAVCLACGFRPKIMVEPLAGHRFRPVEWEWMIKNQAQPAQPGDDAPRGGVTQESMPGS